MKFYLTAINTLVFIGLLITGFSCKGQNKTNSSREPEKTSTLGKKVAGFDGGIMVIFQDSKNNYWFAGDGKGVYKYTPTDSLHPSDKNLLLFTKEDGLCSHSIIGIQEDRFGNIYFDTQEGVSKFDGQKFTTLKIIDSGASRHDWKLGRNDLWFRMGWEKSGPYRLKGQSLYYLEFPKTGQEDEFYAKHPNVPFNPYGIYTMYRDSNGAVWFGTAALGLCRYDGESVSWLYENHLTETPAGGAFGIRSIIEDQAGYFWFCNTRYRYKILENSLERNGTNLLSYKKENGIGASVGNNERDFPYFMSIAEDNHGDLWMVTYDDGVWRNNGKVLIHYPVMDGEKNVLLFSIFKDNQGGLWLGTHHAGVYKYNGRTFERFKL